MALKESFLGGVKLISENLMYNFIFFLYFFYGYSKAYDDAAAR